MERLLRLLMILSGPRSYTRAEIAYRFETSERSVYRHLQILETAGFVLERQNNSGETRYRLAIDNSQNKRLKNLLHFSGEEVGLMYQMLNELEATSAVKERLIRKLHTLYDLKTLTEKERSGELKKIKTLSRAIAEKKQVRIAHYRSSHSSTIADRIVEPFQMQQDYKGIWCFDLKEEMNKQFRISRMGEVKILEKDWTSGEKHRVPFVDAFRMSAPKPLETVELNLTLKAYNLLLEEYPLTKQYISEKDQKYHLHIPIADYHGIGRFVLGLPRDVEVIETEGFKDFLKGMRFNLLSDRI